MTYINLCAGAKNDRSTQLNTDIGANAIIFIYNGSQPANPDTANGSTILAQLQGAPGGGATAPFGVVTNTGVLTASAIASVTAVATGTAGWARICNFHGNGVVDLDVGTSAASLIIGSTSISSGETISITSLTITEN